MKTLEDLLSADSPSARSFWDDCTAIFSSGAGARVLERLCQLEHPLLSPLRAEPEATHVALGRKEVIALLWRRSQPALLPTDIPS
jgi:hypothetical protein